MRIADSHPYHTSEQVSEYVAEARTICEAHEIEWPGNGVLAAKVVELLSLKQIQFEAMQPSPLLQGLRQHG